MRAEPFRGASAARAVCADRGRGGRACVFLPPVTHGSPANTMHGINRALRVSFIGLIISDIVLGKYTDLWAVHIEGGEEVARNIAAKHGFVYHGQVRERSVVC